MQRTFVVCLVSVFGFACGGTSSGSGKEAGVGGVLPGSNLCGTGQVALTKRVPLTVAAAPSDLEVGPAWIAHSSEGYVSYLYGAIKVTNKGTVGHCFVGTTSISFRNQAGEEMKADTAAFVYGRVKVLSVGSTWTCLDPGDSAYFNLIEKLSYFDVASLHVGAVDYHDAGDPAPADLRVTDYSGSERSISIVVDNVGTGSAKNASLVLYVLDTSGEFQFWTFGRFSDTGLWAPRESRTATASITYDAPCPNQLIVPHFEAADASPLMLDEEFSMMADDAVAADTRTASHLRQRQQVESTKRALLRGLDH